MSAVCVVNVHADAMTAMAAASTRHPGLAGGSGQPSGVEADPARYLAFWSSYVLSVAACTLIACLYRNRLTSWRLRDHLGPSADHVTIPKVPSLPFVGNLSLLRGLPHLVVTEMVRRYGHVFRLEAGGDRKFVIVNDIVTIRRAMLEYGAELSGKPQSTTTRLTNTGAQRDMGKRWAKRRHLTMCAFKSFFRQCPDLIRDVCDEELRALVGALRSSSPAGHEPTADVTYFVARTMWRLIYGHGTCPDDVVCAQLRRLATKIDDYTQNSGPFSVLDRFPLLKKIVSGSMTKYKEAVGFMNKFCEDCEAMRLAHHHVGTDREGAPESRDLMTYMLRGAETLTAEDERTMGLNKDLLLNGVADLVRAGTESPSLLLLWVCLVLAKYPEIQKRMYEELSQSYADPTQDIQTVCEASHENAPFTQAVVYEVIRYCSIVPFLKRRCLGDIVLSGYNVQSGTNIIINNHAIGHDPNHWDDPDSFIPDRFLNPEDGTFNMSVLDRFLPFGIGKRRCMGEEIGKLLPFAAVATLVLNFDISAPKPVDLEPAFGITLTPHRQELIFTPRRHEQPRSQPEQGQREAVREVPRSTKAVEKNQPEGRAAFQLTPAGQGQQRHQIGEQHSA